MMINIQYKDLTISNLELSKDCPWAPQVPRPSNNSSSELAHQSEVYIVIQAFSQQPEWPHVHKDQAGGCTQNGVATKLMVYIDTPIINSTY